MKNNVKYSTPIDDCKMCIECITDFRCTCIEDCAKCKLRCNPESKYDISYRLQYYANKEKESDDIEAKYFYRRLYFNLVKSIRNTKTIDLLDLNLDILLYGDNFEHISRYIQFKKDVINAINIS